MRAIPVARNNVGLIYYVVDGPKDGLVVKKNGARVDVNFLSYVSKTDVTRINESEFHEFLWSGFDNPNDRWRNIIESRVQPIPEHMLLGVEAVTAFPEVRKKGYVIAQEKDERAVEFKSLLASGNHEKALGRALGRRARRAATRGVRGFVRGARFDPDAVDADGDGFVQEGTQFARRAGQRARRVRVRAQDRLVLLSSSLGQRQASALAKMQKVLIWHRRRFAKKVSPQDLSQTVQAQNKTVLDRFNGGKPIKTWGDLRNAINVAFPDAVPKNPRKHHPFDFMRGQWDPAQAEIQIDRGRAIPVKGTGWTIPDDDEEVSPYLVDYAIALMFTAIQKPEITKLDLELKEKSRNVHEKDGYILIDSEEDKYGRKQIKRYLRLQGVPEHELAQRVLDEINLLYPPNKVVLVNNRPFTFRARHPAEIGNDPTRGSTARQNAVRVSSKVPNPRTATLDDLEVVPEQKEQKFIIMYEETPGQAFSPLMITEQVLRGQYNIDNQYIIAAMAKTPDYHEWRDGKIYPPDQPKPGVKEEWEAAFIYNTRGTAIHELGHLLHGTQSYTDAIAAIGKKPGDSFTFGDVYKLIMSQVDSMKPDEILRNLRRTLMRDSGVDQFTAHSSYMEKFEHIAQYREILKSISPSLDQFLPNLMSSVNSRVDNIQLSGIDGQPIKLGKGFANYLNQAGLGRQLTPNMRTAWKEDDILTIDLLEKLTELLMDEDQKYYDLVPWSGRQILGPLGVGGQIGFRLDLVTQYGLPKLKTRRGWVDPLPPDEAMPFVNGWHRAADIKKQATPELQNFVNELDDIVNQVVAILQQNGQLDQRQIAAVKREINKHISDLDRKLGNIDGAMAIGDTRDRFGLNPWQGLVTPQFAPLEVNDPSGRPKKITILDVINQSITDDQAKELLKKIIEDQIENIADGARAHLSLPQAHQDPNILKTAGFLSQYLLELSRAWDDLTSDEITTMRQVAQRMQVDGRLAYINRLYEHTFFNQELGFSDYEIMAELAAANAFGHVYALMPSIDAMQQDLQQGNELPLVEMTDEEKRVLEKLLKWMYQTNDPNALPLEIKM